MIYQRYVVASADGGNLHGSYRAVSKQWDNGDGTAMFRVECDDPQFIALNADSTLTIFPSLSAPASQINAKAQAYVTAQAIVTAPTDEVLNVLRAIRDKKGVTAMIDNPA